MSQLLDFLIDNEPGFRRARLPALYSDFQSQRTLNPDGYQANVSAWRRALALIVRSGLAPSPRATTPSLLVLHCDNQLLRALETRQYGQPLALGAVIQEALSARDLIPVTDFLTAKESIYNKSWSVWSIAGWALRQTGVTEFLRSDKLPNGQFVVVANVEETAKLFSTKASANHTPSRLERTFSKTHFHKTFAAHLVDGKTLSESDMDVLLTFLARDKRAILYDGKTIRIRSPESSNSSLSEEPVLTDEDASIAQLKELLAYLHHQTDLLSKKVDELSLTAKQAVSKNNRVAALAALKAKKAAEATLAQRFASAGQLEEVAARLEQASDNAQLVAVMEASGKALASLNARVGGTERVEAVVDRLREQVDATDEVASILAESAGGVMDEAELEGELAAMEGEEKARVEEAERKVKEAERLRKEAEMAREAEETRKRLEGAGEVPTQPAETAEKEGEKEKPLKGLDQVVEGINGSTRIAYGIHTKEPA